MRYRNRRQKLTDQQKKEIINLHSTGKYSFFQLGLKYGVSGAWISKVVKEGTNARNRNNGS